MAPLVATNPLVQVIPGLMIWTIIAFAITFFVLRRYAFGPIQKLIDERRERIRQSVEEADRVREETEEDRQRRLEETRRQIDQATVQALGQIRDEVGKLSLLAAEKITRKSLTDADQQRLIDEALAEIDFSALEGSRS